MSLLTTTGALALAGIVTVWAIVKLTKWDLQADENVQVASVAKIYAWLVVAVMILKLGPAVGTTLVRGLEYVL